MRIRRSLLTLISVLLFSGSNCVYCQSNDNTLGASIIERMIDAQKSFDYVALGRLEEETRNLPKPPDKPYDRETAQAEREANQDANLLWQQATKQSNKAERDETLKLYLLALRKGSGICTQLLETELAVGDTEAIKNDCCTAFSAHPNHEDDRDCGIWYWLGLAYAIQGDNSKSTACFTIALRKICNKGNPSLYLADGNLSAQRFGHLYYHIVKRATHDDSILYCPQASRNFEKAQQNFSEELQDRLRLKYGQQARQSKLSPSPSPSPSAVAMPHIGSQTLAPMPRAGAGAGSAQAPGPAPAPISVATASAGGGGGPPTPVPVGGGATSKGGGGGPAPAPAPSRAGRGFIGSSSVPPLVPLPGDNLNRGGEDNLNEGNYRPVEARKQVDFDPYMGDLNRRIKRAWFPPKGHEADRVKVVFKVHKDGQMTNLRILISSGLQIADAAALKAVENASPFRPLPDGAPDDVDIEFTFDYNVFHGGGHGVFRQF